MLPARSFSKPRFKIRWLAFASAGLAVLLFGAFSETPQAETHAIAPKTITQEVTLPLPTSTINHNEEFWQIEQVRRDDTLPTLLARMNIRDQEAVKFLMLSPEAQDLNTRLMPGRMIEIKSNLDGKLLHLEYELDTENILVAGLTSEGYLVATQKLLLQNHHVLKSAVIRDSLFGATDDAGIPDQIALQIAEIFSAELDFHQDLRPGDKFSVIYEAFYNAGELMKTGNVLAVEFVNRGKTYQAIHFGEASGKYSYYTPEGKSLHKSFLRSPLEFTRVSSSFNNGRFHPILQKIKAHKGVDLAAPTGTRIKASGDGEVEFMGVKGGYGNVIVLKHPNGIKTVYGHLSRFSEAIRKGDKVAQGDIIGYVGMSGLATGPHLHYEFLLDNVHRDPMTVALPTSIPIDSQYKEAFEKQAKNYIAQLDMINTRNQVASKD
jgi:murein DD-endopeptidase MepM/ murein hydrolase activator NlpD